MKEFLIYKCLINEYEDWKKKKERSARNSRKWYFQEYYQKKKLESFKKINNPQ